MSPAITPGPWKATPNGYGVWFVHGGPDLVNDATGTRYRDIVCGGNNHDTLTEANARLIAEAPNLYRELSVRDSDLFMLRRAVEEGDPKAELLIRIDDMIRETKAALAKASAEQVSA